MLKLIQMKIPLAILVALGGLASTAIYQRYEERKAAAQQEQFRREVEQNKKKHNSTAGNEGNTWRTYIP